MWRGLDRLYTLIHCQSSHKEIWEPRGIELDVMPCLDDLPLHRAEGPSVSTSRTLNLPSKSFLGPSFRAGLRKVTRFTPSYVHHSLVPSPRILAYLVRRGRMPPVGMALTVVEHAPAGAEDRDVLKAPPKVITTPCDPWPRPYCLEDGLRKVLPYHYTYNTYCKERWRGRELLDIFASEFRDRPKEYYVR